MLRRSLLLLAWTACAAPTGSGRPRGEVLASGGAIAVAEMPARNIEVKEDAVVAWGMTEVPGSSRMQAAQAMVDGITRTELLKFVQVGVGSMQLDIELFAGGVTHREIELVAAEVVQARLPTANLIQHGWEKVPGDNGVILRLVGRMEVGRQLLRDTFAEKLLPAQADAIVTHLFGKK